MVPLKQIETTTRICCLNLNKLAIDLIMDGELVLAGWTLAAKKTLEGLWELAVEVDKEQKNT